MSIGEWAKWIKLYFQKYNQTITQAAIDLMLERLPLEFNTIKNEVDKLLLFNQPITKSIVAEQTITIQTLMLLIWLCKYCKVKQKNFSTIFISC